MSRKSKARMHLLDTRRSAVADMGICGHIGECTEVPKWVTCRVCLATMKTAAEKAAAKLEAERDKRGDGAPPAVLSGPGQSVLGSDGERAIARSVAGEELAGPRWSSFQAAWCAYVKISDERRSVASSSSPDRFGHRNRDAGAVPTTPRDSQPDFLDFERALARACAATVVGLVSLSAEQVRQIAELRVCGKRVKSGVRGSSGVAIPGYKGTYTQRIEADADDVASAFGLTRHQVGIVVRRVVARGNDELAGMGLVRRRPARQSERASGSEEASVDLFGWKQISQHMNKSEDVCRRYASRDQDPLPVYRQLGEIVAKRSELDAWKGQQIESYS